ncbi:MAG TPA: tetratricopeptide repeat protein, partial [Ktedonobacteraceae bacterium]|nr:tetratricopeptide repeat protein [Ktedonobacteraceae bacterium]
MKPYRECIRRLPNWYGCYLGLAEMFNNQRQDQAGVQSFQQIAASDPRNPAVLFALGWLYAQNRQIPEARQTLSTALTLAKANADLDLMAHVWSLLADCFGVSGDHPEEEVTYTQEALKAYEELADEYGVLKSLQTLAGNYLARGDKDQFSIYLDRFYTRAIKSGDIDWQIGALMYMGRNLQLSGQYEKARKQYEDASALCHHVPDNACQLEILNRLSHIAIAQGSYEEGLDFLEQARQGWRKRDVFSFNEADISRTMGALYERMGDYSRDLEAQQHAIEIFERGHWPLQAEATKGNIGLIYEALGDYQTAEEYLQKALQGGIQYHDKGEQERNLLNLGALYLETGSYDKALTALNNAFDLSQNDRYMPYRVEELVSLGEVLDKRGEVDAAQQRLEEGLELAREVHSIYLEAGADSLLGRHYLKTGEYRKAEQFFRDALAIAEKARLRELMWDAQEGLGEALEEMHNLPEALDQYRRAVDVIEAVRGQIPFS